MEYSDRIEEVEFSPEFGYGYEPGAKKKKKKDASDNGRFKGMKKPLANPLVPLAVSVLFAVLLLVCVLLVSLSTKPGATARVPVKQETVACTGARSCRSHV